VVKRYSLAFRLTAILGLAWLFFFVILGSAVWHTTQRLVQEAHTDKAQALASQLATVSLDAVLLHDYGTLERYLADLAGPVVYTEVRRADGQLLASSGQRNDRLSLVRAPMHIMGGGEAEVIGEVLAQYDPSPARRTAWQLAALLAFGLALFAGLTFWAMRRLLIRELVVPVATLIASADPERPPLPIPAAAAAEVAELAHGISALRQRVGRHIAEAEEAAQSRNEALRRLCSEQRLAAVGQIAGEVAHELNTPLSNILGYAQSILPHTRDEASQEALRTIEDQARRAGQIVRDMLNAARAPAPNLQTVDLVECCIAFLRLVTPLARKQGATLRLNGLDRLDAQADVARIEQVLFNLTFNAIQAGATEISLNLTDVAHPCLSVHDNGPGLPESVRARLFEPFVTTKPAGQGTGLGLAICQRLAREMRGDLICLDTGPGTEFQLNLCAPEQNP
jgi:signal transduction histidine kinase